MLMNPALTVAYTEQESHMATKLKDVHTFKYGRTFSNKKILSWLKIRCYGSTKINAYLLMHVIRCNC